MEKNAEDALKPIEYEQVTVRLPKQVMAFLRFQAGEEDVLVEEKIEQAVLADVRAEMEGLNGEELIAALGMDRIFYETLDDEHYNPQKLKQEAQQQ
jgi:hypothetical protein